MKQVGYILFAVLFFTICTLPALLMPVAQAAGEEELPALPKLYTPEEGVNSNFGEETESYLTQNFSGRDQLVSANARLTGALFHTSSERQVILGQDGWLFYEQTLQDYLGTNPLTEAEMADIAKVMELIEEFAAGQGSDFLFTVAPNKNSICGEYMPYYTIPAQAENDLARLAAVLAVQGVSYLDLYSLLDGQHELYYKRDTHWNDVGARLAYDAMMNELGHPHESFEDAAVTATTIDWADLGRMLMPVNAPLDEGAWVNVDFGSYYQFVGPSKVQLSQLKTVSDVGQGSLLMFRDSFGNALIPFVSTAWADATYLSATPHAPDQLEPGQTLIIEIVQRNLRVLLSAAPRMPAPARQLEGVSEVTDPAMVLESAEAGDYLHVYGAVDAALAEGADALLVAVQSDAGSEYYEAFPAWEAGLGEQDLRRGFSLYIPKDSLPSGDFDISPIVQFENASILIKTYS